MNSLYGKALCHHAHLEVEQGRLDEAQELLNEFCSLITKQPCSMEREVEHQVDVLSARILRFKGEFLSALNRLWPSGMGLAPQWITRNLPGPTVCYTTSTSRISLFCAILCEMDLAPYAQFILKETLLHRESENIPGRLTDDLLRLALGEAYLYEKQEQAADSVYRLLNAERFNSPINRIRVHLGYARIHYLRKEWVEADAKWTLVADSIKHNGWEDGFLDMVSAFTLASVKRRLGHPEAAQTLTDRGAALFQRIGVRHWFTGMGTVWIRAVWVHLSFVPPPPSPGRA